MKIFKKQDQKQKNLSYALKVGEILSFLEIGKNIILFEDRKKFNTIWRQEKI